MIQTNDDFLIRKEHNIVYLSTADNVEIHVLYIVFGPDVRDFADSDITIYR